jgi:hypothetical protein
MMSKIAGSSLGFDSINSEILPVYFKIPDYQMRAFCNADSINSILASQYG